MATWRAENSMLTAKGVEILNKLKAGQGAITITRIVSGSGRVSESQLYRQTQVSGSMKQFAIDNYNISEEGSEITFSLTNATFTESYEVHQLGVYVSHPDYPGEILYHISQCDAGDFDTIPAYSENVVTFGYSVYLIHGNSSTINISVNPEGLVSIEAFMALKNSYETFKFELEEDKLITVDDKGNLIPSGRNIVNGTKLVINDAIEHRALNLSVIGSTTQATPSVASPKSFVNTKIVGIVANKGGKNLFNIQATPLRKSSDKYSTITTTPNSVLVTIPSGATLPYIGYLTPVEVGKTYTISFEATTNSVVSYMELDAPINDITSNEYGTNLTAKKTFTATKPYLLICSHPTTASTGLTFGLTKVQVELGSSSTSYTPHTGKTIILPTAIELNSLGDYKDTIEWDGAKWWKVQRVGELVVDGTNIKMSQGVSSSSTSYVRLSVANGNDFTYTNVMPNTPFATTHGSPVSPKETDEFYAYYNINNNGIICCHFLNSAFGLGSSQAIASRVTTINNWLVAQNSAGTPLKIRYILPAPIITEITLTDILEMYPTLTNMSTLYSGNVPMLNLGYAINTTDSTTMYILKSLTRKSEVQTANTFALATIEE